MGDQESGRGLSEGERRQLHEANAEAAVFYRRELLRTAAEWPAALLKEWGVEAILDRSSVWQVGYAPDGGARLVDHLQKNGFAPETLMRAGLMSWTNDGRVVDRYQDQLVMVSRDQRLDPVGFVGIDRYGQARLITPETPVHRPLEALVGVLEQISVLQAGATTVIVDHPLDAIAMELAVGQSGKEKLRRRSAARTSCVERAGTDLASVQQSKPDHRDGACRARAGRAGNRQCLPPGPCLRQHSVASAFGRPVGADR